MPDVATLDGWRLAAAAALVGLGALFMAAAALGLARQRDLYGRAHALSVLDRQGWVSMAAGLAMAAWDWRAAGLILAAALLRMVAAPRATRAILSAGLAVGDAPASGASGADP